MYLQHHFVIKIHKPTQKHLLQLNKKDPATKPLETHNTITQRRKQLII